METKIWYDFIHTKYGDEYLILYLGRQRNIRKIFKIVTIILSAGGIWGALKEAKIPTLISCTAIGIVQVVTSVESFLIHSEQDLDKLCTLRLMYFEKSVKLEELWISINSKKITEQEATEKFFEFRKTSKEIEELDNKLNIRKFRRLEAKANKSINNYVKTYYS